MGLGGHLAIAGNIGVGKSTLTALLAERLEATPYFESVDGHPYLERFYEDMKRWAFHSQFYFLTQAFRQHCEILESPATSVQDRTIYEHFHVFARSLNEQGLLPDDDLAVLSDHFDGLTQLLPGPDLMVYLRASVPTLESRIRTRARDVEASVERGYLEQLERRYEEWIGGYSNSELLIIETDEFDVHDAAQRTALLDHIERRLAEAQGRRMATRTTQADYAAAAAAAERAATAAVPFAVA